MNEEKCFHGLIERYKPERKERIWAEIVAKKTEWASRDSVRNVSHSLKPVLLVASVALAVVFAVFIGISGLFGGNGFSSSPELERLSARAVSISPSEALGEDVLVFNFRKEHGVPDSSYLFYNKAGNNVCYTEEYGDYPSASDGVYLCMIDLRYDGYADRCIEYLGWWRGKQQKTTVNGMLCYFVADGNFFIAYFDYGNFRYCIRSYYYAHGNISGTGNDGEANAKYFLNELIG